LLLLNLLLPAAGFVHAIASGNHHTDIVAAETGDADECEDTHHTDHATLLSASDDSVLSAPYRLAPALLAYVIPCPLDPSLNLQQVVVLIFHPPQNLV
jgi:hypothetical protein